MHTYGFNCTHFNVRCWAVQGSCTYVHTHTALCITDTVNVQWVAGPIGSLYVVVKAPPVGSHSGTPRLHLHAVEGEDEDEDAWSARLLE